MCILHALHAPDEQDGIPATVGALYMAEALVAIIKLGSAYVTEK